MTERPVSELEAIARYRDIIEAELDQDEIDYGNQPGLRALHVVARAGELAVARQLLLKKANVNFCTSKGLSPLHYAVLSGKVAMIQLLLLYGAGVNAQSHRDGRTPLFTAAEKGEFDIVKCLLENGANPELKTTDGILPKEAASAKGYTQILAILETMERRGRLPRSPTEGTIAAAPPLNSLPTSLSFISPQGQSLFNVDFATTNNSDTSSHNWFDPNPPKYSDPPPTYDEVMSSLSSQEPQQQGSWFGGRASPDDDSDDDTTALLGDS